VSEKGEKKGKRKGLLFNINGFAKFYLRTVTTTCGNRRNKKKRGRERGGKKKGRGGGRSDKRAFENLRNFPRVGFLCALRHAKTKGRGRKKKKGEGRSHHRRPSIT